MSYSQEEWEWIKKHLVEGVTYTHQSSFGTDTSPGTILPTGKVAFTNPNFTRVWDIQKYGYANRDRMFDFKWPNGTPMVPFVEYDGTKWDPVEAKAKSLDARFKNKSLPKCKQKALPLPA